MTIYNRIFLPFAVDILSVGQTQMLYQQENNWCNARRNLLKGTSFQSIEVLQNCMCKILKLRQAARTFIKFEIGVAMIGCIQWVLCFRVICDAASNVDAKISIILRRKDWIWSPTTQSKDLVERFRVSCIHLADEDKTIQCMGGIQFGSLQQFLGMPLFCGWPLKIGFQPEIDYCNGEIMAMHCVFYRKYIEHKNHIFFRCGLLQQNMESLYD